MSQNMQQIPAKELPPPSDALSGREAANLPDLEDQEDDGDLAEALAAIERLERALRREP
jgi:hypothetical protein